MASMLSVVGMVLRWLGPPDSPDWLHGPSTEQQNMQSAGRPAGRWLFSLFIVQSTDGTCTYLRTGAFAFAMACQ